VIVGVESTDSRNYGEKHGTLHLTDGETVKREKREEYKLDESHRWECGELETLDDGVGFRGGLGVGSHHFSLGITGHFIIY
jgi:hypothetical protein